METPVGAPVRTVTDPLVGRVLDGRYRLGARIARGGMATVYAAHDLRLDRPCAVKVLDLEVDGLDSEAVAARFVREAHAAARLAHPHVVAVTDQGDDQGVLFLVMEHVPGRTLRDLVRAEAPLPPSRALALLEPVLRALAEAHRCGLVHRDVKPENVLIRDDGVVKVADFGLARAFGGDTQHTTAGVLIGTVSYLAPEVIVDGRADPRADVYAAGVVLFELLTGRKPHEGEGAIQIAFKHVNEDVPPPSSALPAGVGWRVPAYVDALVLRATARDRDLRPADAKVMLHQLHRVRAALQDGAADDPELTADLIPTVVVPEQSSPSPDAEATSSLERAAIPGWVNEPSSGEPVFALRPTPPVRPVASAQPTAPGVPAAGATARTRPRRSLRGPLLLLLVVLLTALVAYAGWWVGIGRYTSTPGVLNVGVQDATARLAQEGLELAVAERRFSETVTAGSIISSDPVPGGRIVAGGTVEVVVSKGPERYAVPRLRGQPLEEVEDALSGRNLVLDDVVEAWSEEVPEGDVLSTSPAGGTELRPGSAVDLTVSKGPRPIRIPDLTGRPADRAAERLTALGFEVRTEREHSDTVEEGRVVSQDPDDGKGFRDDVIELVVSEGPVMVPVPNLVADSLEDATAALEELGLEIEVVESDLYIGLDTVVDQEPGEGGAVPEGGTVTVYVV